MISSYEKTKERQIEMEYESTKEKERVSEK